MPIVADAAVAVRGDMSKFNKDVTAGASKSGTAAGKTFGEKMNTALNPKALFGGFAAAFAGSQVIQLIGDATNAAAEFGDSVSATGVIFGEEAIPAMEEWADAASSAFGASKQQALAAANQFAVFGKSAGLVGDDLKEFSQEMVQLGGDLASFFGGTTEEAITAVGAALRGESEPIRRYGVLLDDATLRQKAFELGLISTTKNALTPQQRVLAAQASILEQTQDAQGDFERTSDGMANTQREVAAELENVNIELGEKLMPVMLDFVTFIKNDGIPILREFIELLDMQNENSADGIPILEQAEDILNGVSEQALKVADSIRGGNNAVLRFAEVSELSYRDARRAVKDYADAHEVSFDEASDALIEAEKRTREGLDRSNAALADGVTAVDGWEKAFTQSANTAADNFDSATDEIVEDAQETPGQMAQALLDGLDEWENSWALMEEAATREMDKGRRIRNNLARLASVELIQGLRSQDAARRAAAEQVRLDLIRALEIDGYQFGFNLAATFAAGMIAGKGIVVDAAGQLASSARSQVAINSEPEDPNSPLRGITKWGGNLVETYAQGILDALNVSSNAARALAGSLVPATSSPGLSAGTAAVTTAGMGAGDTYLQLVVEGKPKTVSTAGEMWDGFETLAGFNDRSMT